MSSKWTEYKNQYNKEHYKSWRIVLTPSEYNEIEEMRSQTGLSRRDFLKMLVGKNE